MNLIIYKKRYPNASFITNFRTQYYFNKEMKHLASDLLEDGFTPPQITKAVQKAMAAARTANLAIEQHFFPVYTDLEGNLVKDCKLSNIGYGLVLMNGNVNLPIVAEWQLKILKNTLWNY